MNRFPSICALIPAYNPGEELARTVAELKKAGFGNLLIVDDGSREKAVFERIFAHHDVALVTHAENAGKGAALKSGFRHILDNMSGEIQTIVTLDADGQHLAKDVLKVAEAAVKSGSSMILGVRNFDDDVPLRSAFGNKLTRAVLDSAENIELSDTQTGLRAIPLSLAEATLELRGDRYQFELECILLAGRSGIDIREVQIDTVYIDDNNSSHFNPLLVSCHVN